MNEDGILEIDVQKIMKNIWNLVLKYWFILIIAIVSVLFLTYEILSYRYVPMYRADVTFTVSTKISNGNNDIESSYGFDYVRGMGAQLSKTFPYILKSDAFNELMKKDLGVDQYNGSINISTISGSNMFNLSVTSTNKEDALTILSAVVTNYPKVASYVIGESKLNIIQQPAVVDQPINQDTVKKNVLYVLIGSILIELLFLLVASINKKDVHSIDDIQEVSNLKYLGSIPRTALKKRSKLNSTELLVTNSKIGQPFVESYKVIASRVIKELRENMGKVIMVTSTKPGEGKTNVVTNLAYTLYNQGKKVVIIKLDTSKRDKRKIQVVKENMFNISALFFTQTLQKSAIECLEKNRMIYVYNYMDYDAGFPKLSSKDTIALIDSIKKSADYVIIDTVSISEDANALMLGEVADGTIYVVRQDYTNRNHIVTALSKLNACHANVLGCVMSFTEHSSREYGYYGYGKYRRYGSEKVT